VSADHIGDVLRSSANSGQSSKELPSDQLHSVGELLLLGTQPGIDEHYSIRSSNQKAADRQPGCSSLIEHIRSSIRCHSRTEIAWTCHERTVGYWMHR
jgi:hypothetical protein